MSTKIISIILSIIMTIMTTLFPGFSWPGKDGMEIGDFLTEVGVAFGYTLSETDEVLYGISPDNEYYDAVAAAAQYNVLVDYEEIDVLKFADTEFVATVLVNAANLTTDEEVEIANAADFENIEKVSIAVANDLIPVEADGTVSTDAMAVNDIKAAIELAASLRGVSGDDFDDFDLVEERFCLTGNEVTTCDDFDVGLL